MTIVAFLGLTLKSGLAVGMPSGMRVDDGAGDVPGEVGSEKMPVSEPSVIRPMVVSAVNRWTEEFSVLCDDAIVV